MRPIYLDDLMDAARVLRLCPSDQWPSQAQEIVRRADVADRYRKSLCKAHPSFGTGTLSSAARTFRMAPVPANCDADQLACLAKVIAALRDHKTRHAQIHRH